MRATSLAAALVCSMLSGCISVVEVKKFTGTENGLRYALPDPYILVTPQGDGTATYEWVFLPNLENEYVVQAAAYATKFNLDMVLENGMLKSVTTKAENAAVAAKAAEMLGNVEAARKDAAVAAAKAKADKVTASQKDIAAAQIEVDQAQAKLDILASSPTATATEKLNTQIDLAKAQAKLRNLKTSADKLAGSGNVPGVAAASLGQAWGPVLLRVVPEGEGIKLVVVDVQRKFDTTTAAAGAPKPPAKRKLSLKDVTVAQGATRITIQIDPQISIVDPKISLIRGTDPVANVKCDPALSADNKTVVISCQPVLKAGDYVVQLGYKVTSADANPTSDKISFSVK